MDPAGQRLASQQPEWGKTTRVSHVWGIGNRCNGDASGLGCVLTLWRRARQSCIFFSFSEYAELAQEQKIRFFL